MTTSLVLMFTIWLQAFILEDNAATKLPLEMPLTPPRTPLELLYSGYNMDSDMRPLIALSGAKIVDNLNVNVLNLATMVSIGYNDLLLIRTVKD